MLHHFITEGLEKEAGLKSALRPGDGTGPFRSPVYHACRSGSVELVRFLFSSSFSRVEIAEQLPFRCPAYTLGNKKLFEALLDLGYSAGRSFGGRNAFHTPTPLHLMARDLEKAPWEETDSVDEDSYEGKYGWNDDDFDDRKLLDSDEDTEAAEMRSSWESDPRFLDPVDLARLVKVRKECVRLAVRSNPSAIGQPWFNDTCTFKNNKNGLPTCLYPIDAAILGGSVQALILFSECWLPSASNNDNDDNAASASASAAGSSGSSQAAPSVMLGLSPQIVSIPAELVMPGDSTIDSTSIEGVLRPAILHAFSSNDLPTIHSVAELLWASNPGWEKEYFAFEPAYCHYIAFKLAVYAISSAHPSTPAKEAVALRKVVELFLSKGFSHTFDDVGYNTLLMKLGAVLDETKTPGEEMSEQGAIEVLRLYNSFGRNVTESINRRMPRPPGHRMEMENDKGDPLLLTHHFAFLKRPVLKVLDFAIGELGIDVDAFFHVRLEDNPFSPGVNPRTALSFARNVRTAIHLLQKHKASPVIDGLRAGSQPISLLLAETICLTAAAEDKNDASTLLLMSTALELHPVLLAHPCFASSAVAQPMQLDPANLLHCLGCDGAFAFLCRSKPKGFAEAIKRSFVFENDDSYFFGPAGPAGPVGGSSSSDGGKNHYLVGTLAQVYAAKQLWPRLLFLLLALQKGDSLETVCTSASYGGPLPPFFSSPDSGARPAASPARAKTTILPSLHELVSAAAEGKRTVGAWAFDGTAARPSPPPRQLIALVKMLYRKEMMMMERGDGRAAAEAEGGGEATTSLHNAFEDPSFSAKKPLTAKEEKAKARKKAAKKKAKTKKREAAETGAAGASVARPSVAARSDSDDSDDDDDNDVNDSDAEERMIANAPAFDLEREKAEKAAKE